MAKRTGVSTATQSNGRKRAVESPRRPATRARILDAALELFLERGFDGTTVTAIERAAGLAAGSGSFYRHFRSKQDVLVAVVERESSRISTDDRVARMALERIDDPKKRLALEYELRLEEMAQHHPIWLLVMAERERIPELERAFASGLRTSKWNLAWERDATHALALAALTGYAYMSVYDGTPFSNIAQEEFVETLVEMVARSGPVKPVRKR
jgi:AcrR family transcriptional regulator